MGYFNFYFIKKILSKLFTKRTLIYIIIFLVIIILKSNVFAVSETYDVEQSFVEEQLNVQDEFAFFAFYPYYQNTEFWQNCILPVLQDLGTGTAKDIYIQKYITSNYVQYVVSLYKTYLGTDTTVVWNSRINSGNTITLKAKEFQPNINGNTNGYTTYYINWYPSTNTGELLNRTGTSTRKIPVCICGLMSDNLREFIRLYSTGGGTYSDYLNTISNYLDNIDTVNTDILSTLTTITNNLSQISTNTSTNYSQELSQISGKVSDLLDDNDTIISQNSEMIQQQEQINDNLETVNDSVQDLKDTITDDTIETTASDLPSVDVTNPAGQGIDNIFTSIYNAFCTGQAQHIILPIPYTNKNIDIDPDFLSNLLQNSKFNWLRIFINTLWGYLIGRYIVLDIYKKIEKIKSGNITEIENNNIKGEML